jgi:hypothetical protein
MFEHVLSILAAEEAMELRQSNFVDRIAPFERYQCKQKVSQKSSPISSLGGIASPSIHP